MTDRNVSAERALGGLLRMLAEHHRVHALSASSAESGHANVFSEIMAHLQAWTPAKAIPVSLLATLESMAGAAHRLSIVDADAHVGTTLSGRAAPDQAAIERKSDDMEALRLILRQMMNTIEEQAHKELAANEPPDGWPGA